MSTVEAFELFLAAVRAVAPHAISCAPAFDSGAQLLDWVTRTQPAAEILARLNERERADLRHVLDGMRREVEGARSRAPGGS